MTTTNTAKTITVNGTSYPVSQSYSSGPGCAPHTYRVSRSWVCEVGGSWTIQRDGQTAIPCTVAD